MKPQSASVMSHAICLIHELSWMRGNAGDVYGSGGIVRFFGQYAFEHHGQGDTLQASAHG
jgi:hypothetical protein